MRISYIGLNELLRKDHGFYWEYFNVLLSEYKEVFALLMLSVSQNNLVDEAFAETKYIFRNGIRVSPWLQNWETQYYLVFLLSGQYNYLPRFNNDVFLVTRT